MFICFYIFMYLFLIYLKEEQRIPLLVSSSNLCTTQDLGQAKVKSWELSLSVPGAWAQGPRNLSHHPLLSRVFFGKKLWGRVRIQVQVFLRELSLHYATTIALSANTRFIFHDFTFPWEYTPTFFNLTVKMLKCISCIHFFYILFFHFCSVISF